MTNATPALVVLIDAEDSTGVIVVRAVGLDATEEAMDHIERVLGDHGRVYDARIGEWFELTFDYLCGERSKKERRKRLSMLASVWCDKLRAAGFDVEGPQI